MRAIYSMVEQAANTSKVEAMDETTLRWPQHDENVIGSICNGDTRLRGLSEVGVSVDARRVGRLYYSTQTPKGQPPAWRRAVPWAYKDHPVTFEETEQALRQRLQAQQCSSQCHQRSTASLGPSPGPPASPSLGDAPQVIHDFAPLAYLSALPTGAGAGRIGFEFIQHPCDERVRAGPPHSLEMPVEGGSDLLSALA
jgi:hypothetical protein